MSCFWNSLMRTRMFTSVRHSKDIIPFLKKNNQLCSVIVNGTILSKTLQKENYNAIQELTMKSYHNGYLTSMCDPVLCTLCFVFDCHIIHEWRLNKVYKITYSPNKNLDKNNKPIYTIYSNSGHAW